MKKSILVILLVLLAFSLWSVLAIAKDKVAQKPTQVQKTEPNVAPEAFPKVMLPQAQPVRPTQEDFKREVLDRKGWTPDGVKNMQGPSVPAVNLEAAEKEEMPTLCTVGNALAGGYYHSAAGGNPYFYCWGEELWATFINPEDSLFGNPRCAYPIYPFLAKSVMFALYSLTDTAHVLFQPEIRDVVYDAEGCAYPGAALLTGPVYNLALGAGGVSSVYLSLVDSVCLYQPWFAVMHFLNSDDFFDTTYCAPINTSSWFSELFDNSGRTCQSYWNPYGPGGSWYDVTLYGISNGAVRVRTRGYSKSENTCVIPVNPWYRKDSLALAPCGVPDFDQVQFPPAFCGPTAEASSYWWLNAKWGFDPAPMDPVALVNEIAAAAGTVPGVGTNCDQLEAAILQVIKAHGAWWFTETTVYKPDFWDLQKELKQGHDITLLLGFWQFDGANWYRFGGHFVTIAGVDIYNYRFAFSDPAIDNAEAHFPNPVFGAVCHTDPFPHPGMPLVHNNPANVSHDFYDVAWPSPSPGGYLWLPYYEVNWPDFNGQNAGPLPNTGPYNPQLPVQVEIEQAIKVWPGDPYQYCDLVGGNVTSTITNYGRLGPQTGHDFKWPTQTDTTNQLFDGSLCIGTSAADMAVSVTSGKGYKPIDPCSVTEETLYVDGSNLLLAQVGRASYQPSENPDIRVKVIIIVFNTCTCGDSCDCVPNCPGKSVAVILIMAENVGISPIPGINQGLFFDFDVNRHGGYNLGGGDSTLNTIWQDDGAGAVMVTLVPETPGLISPNGTLGEQNSYLYNVVPGPYDSLYALMNVTNWDLPNTAPPVFDWSVLLVQPKYDLAPGASMLNSYFVWGYEGLPDSSIGNTKMNKGAQHNLYKLLQLEGFYRGDVNKDGKLDVADVIYTINYLFKGGPKPKPMVSQVDVNNDGKTDVADVIYIINRLFKGGPAPLDKDRFMPGAVARPGLFGDAQWKTLGQ